jgi:hypothetical protein
MARKLRARALQFHAVLPQTRRAPVFLDARAQR